MNILEAMGDPKLFGPHFKGDTWKPWRAFLAALFALPMDADAMALYQAHTGRQNPPEAAFKEAALIIGRRGGKSRVLATIAVFLGTFRDYTPYLSPGEVATVAVIAADRKQARAIFRYASGLLDKVDMLAGMVEDETADTITLNNGVVIEIATASFRVTRGYTFAAVLGDEIAFWRTDDSANPDTEIVKALRPGMATIPGAVLLLASSPYRKRGVLYNLFTRHFGKDGARVLVWRASTLAMNPSIDPEIVAEAYEDDPEGASAEYGAEFRSDLSDFVPREVVEACTVEGRFELPRGNGAHVAFVDPSGGSGTDSMTLAIAHTGPNGPVLDALREIKPLFSPDAAVKDFAALLKAYGLSEVTGDNWGGDFVREPFQREGITYKLSDKSKREIYLNALPMLNSGKVELLENKALLTQLCALERRTARGGKDSIDHPPGGHDDVANAAMGALLLAGGGHSSFDSSYAWAVEGVAGEVDASGRWIT
ncbi:MAG: hypothetical protein ACRYGM_05225 [Janthinobacterium lividum]